ncbi:hypothetical protein AAV96_12595 [Acinetobacter sp. AG1]|uniref:hypothetical protein n=1 Tax=Acinetobacter TaxID=469 RepID=UPI0006296152|nr:hypothetical protein [Acinetobacter sp. AG1]KKW77500.1 hypothetical protein AAV96_12595 [Acinetobacter sp. AG1]
MQPIQITYSQICSLLIRLLIQQDSTFPCPIKHVTNHQFSIYFDYSDLFEWHEKRKLKILHNTNTTFSDQVSTIHQSYNYLVTQNAYEELNLLYLQAKTQKEIGSFHGKGLNEHKYKMKYLNQKISRYEEDLQLKLWEHINELDSKKPKTK